MPEGGQPTGSGSLCFDTLAVSALEPPGLLASIAAAKFLNVFSGVRFFHRTVSRERMRATQRYRASWIWERVLLELPLAPPCRAIGFVRWCAVMLAPLWLVLCAVASG